MERKTLTRITLIWFALSMLALSLTLNIQPTEAQPDPDLNDDGVVNIQDIELVALALGSYPGHLRWNAEADMNQDEKITLIDIALVAHNFGTYQ